MRVSTRPRRPVPGQGLLDPSVTRMRVRPADLDFYLHVNNGVYLQMMDVARSNYIADIGGFLGMGTHTVLLDRDVLNMAMFGDDTVLATNYSQEELEALPEFDMETVRD